MDMSPNFERLHFEAEPKRRPLGTFGIACLLGLAVCACLLGLKLALGPGFALLDATGAVFGP